MGELFAILSAATWTAIGAVARTQRRHDPWVLNAWRTTFGSLVLIWILFWRPPSFTSASGIGLIALLTGSIIGPGLGDTLFFASARSIGVSRAMPVSSIYPAFTSIFAILFLGERVTTGLALGVPLITAGVVLVATMRPAQNGTNGSAHWNRRGLLMAGGAALCWGTSSTLIRIALDSIDPLTATAIRLPIVAILLWAFAFYERSHRKPGQITDFRPDFSSALAGVLSAASATFFLFGLSLAGAARGTVLSSISPIFAAVAGLFLGERLDWRILLGSAITVLGTWVLVAF